MSYQFLGFGGGQVGIILDTVNFSEKKILYYPTYEGAN